MKKLILVALALALSAVAAPALASNCSTYPYTLVNGTTADANQVMANLNLILNCANQNLAHSGANSDITQLSGLTTPLTVGQGGTGNTTGAPTFAAQNNNTILGNVSGGSAGATPLTAAQVETMIQGQLPFEFYTFVGGLTGNAWTLANYVPSTNLTLVTAKSACKVGTAATGATTYTLKDNGVSIGTAVISAGLTTCTATITASPYSFTAGHTLSITGPGTGDATAADVGITFGGTRG